MTVSVSWQDEARLKHTQKVLASLWRTSPSCKRRHPFDLVFGYVEVYSVEERQTLAEGGRESGLMDDSESELDIFAVSFSRR